MSDIFGNTENKINIILWLLIFLTLVCIAGLICYALHNKKQKTNTYGGLGNYYGGVKGDEQKPGLLDAVRSLVGMETSVERDSRLDMEYKQKKADKEAALDKQYADEKEYQADTNHAINVNKERKAAKAAAEAAEAARKYY